MRTIRLSAVLIAFSSATALGQAPPPARWSWFENCKNERTLALEVLLNGKQIYRSSFPICKVSVPPNAAGREKIVACNFKGGHVFQGKYRTSASQTVVGNIWQAGAEPDMLLLGLTFSAKNQVMLNTVHFAKPNEASATTLDGGLMAKTYPIGAKKPANRKH